MENDVQKCPYCNGEMQLGYVQGADTLSWVRKVQPIAAFAAFGGFNIATERGCFFGAIVEAYNCKGCKKIIIQYGKE